MPAPTPAGARSAATWFWDWRRHARCRAMDTDEFFTRDDERPAERIRREFAVEQICHACPVQHLCRDYAPTTGEHHRICCAMTESERRTPTTPTSPQADRARERG